MAAGRTDNHLCCGIDFQDYAAAFPEMRSPIREHSSYFDVRRPRDPENAIAVSGFEFASKEPNRRPIIRWQQIPKGVNEDIVITF